MTTPRSTSVLTAALAGFTLSMCAFAQDACKTVQQGSTLPETSGCFPLTYKPADGGPVQTIWLPATFVGPMQKAGTTAAAVKRRDLDFGVSAYYTRPDYAQSVNIDVGAFVTFSGRIFGAEILAADTISSARHIREPYIVAGPRIQYRGRHFTVYGKAQAGLGHFDNSSPGSENNKQNFVVENFGAGLEVKLSHHLKLRAVDANYQVWPTFAPTNLTPFHIGSGLAFSL